MSNPTATDQSCDELTRLRQRNAELTHELHHAVMALSQAELELSNLTDADAFVQQAITACRDVRCYYNGTDSGATELTLEQRCYAATQYVIATAFSGGSEARTPIAELRHNTSAHFHVTDAEMAAYIEKQSLELNRAEAEAQQNGGCDSPNPYLPSNSLPT